MLIQIKYTENENIQLYQLIKNIKKIKFHQRKIKY